MQLDNNNNNNNNNNDNISNIKIDHVLPTIIVNPKPEYENVAIGTKGQQISLSIII